MAKVGKKYAEAAKMYDKYKLYEPAEAIDILKKMDTAKFDETVELAVNLNVDPKYADQQVRGALVLPHGIGKTKSVLVFAQGEKEKEAQEAGAEFVGADDLIEKIIGKILGPKGLMPNPKVGTVTMDIAKAVSESKAGKVEYRTDKAGNIHSPIGKKSFDANKLIENLTTLVDTLIKVKPSGAKGQYIKTITVSSTMGPGIHINPFSVKGIVKADEQ